jgi:hypothetical protein
VTSGRAISSTLRELRCAGAQCYNPAVQQVIATLRTAGVLVGIWAILAIVALATGVVDYRDFRLTAAAAPEAEVDAGVASDAGVAEEQDASVPDAGPPEVAQPAEPTEPAPLPTESARRFTVCASTDPSITIAQVFGDERPELIIGCSAGWEVLTNTADGPVRIAMFTTPGAASGLGSSTGPAAIGDVDGDAIADLALPLSYETEQGGNRGGGVYWIPVDAFGGIREPVALAPIAGVEAAIAALDGESGAEIVAMNGGNALAQLPSEAWVFGGGAAPARLTTLSTGMSGAAVRTGDLDRDANVDVVALASGRVTIHFGDGHGAFPRSHSFELAGAREIALGDLNGDAGTDLAVLGEGLVWIAGGPINAMEPHAIDGVPAALRGLAIADTNGDEKLDLFGWDHPRLVVLRQNDERAFVPEPSFELAAGGTFGPRRHALADLDLDGAADDLVLLGTSAEGGPIELVYVIDAFRRIAIEPAEAANILDAPLVLRAALPQAG